MRTGLPVEVSSPLVDRGGRHLVLLPAQAPQAPRWSGPLPKLVEAVAAQTGVSVAELGSPSRRREAVQARALVLVTGAWVLRRELKEVAAAVGRSGLGASHLLKTAGPPLVPMAEALAAALRGSG